MAEVITEAILETAQDEAEAAEAAKIVPSEELEYHPAVTVHI